MLHKRKQLLQGVNQDLVEDIEENTNFLINKRKSRLRSKSKEKSKYLYHTINDGFMKIRIVNEQQQNDTKIFIKEDQPFQNTLNYGNAALYQTLNQDKEQERPGSSIKQRDNSFLFQSQAPRVQLIKKGQQDDILAQFDQQQRLTYNQTENLNKQQLSQFQSRNIHTSSGIRTSQLKTEITMNARQIDKDENQVSQLLSNLHIQNTAYSSRTQTQRQDSQKQNFADKFRFPSRKLKNSEYLDVIKNRGEYRKDRLIQKFKNQVKQLVDPSIMDKNKDLYVSQVISNERNHKYSSLNTQKIELSANLQTTDNYQNTQNSQWTPSLNSDAKIQRPMSQNFQRIRRPSFRKENQMTIEVSKVLKFMAQTQKDLRSSRISKTIGSNPNDLILITGSDTTGLPDTISPRQRIAQMPDFIRQTRNRDYISSMVTEVIKSTSHQNRNQRKLEEIENDDTNKQRFKDALIQVIQTDSKKAEFQILRFEDIQSKYSTIKGNKSKSQGPKVRQQLNTFQDKNCKKFIISKKEQIHEIISNHNATPVAHPTLTAQYQDINQMNELSLIDFINQNHLHPLQYQQTFENQSANQVSKFEFFLVKGNQYLHKEDFNKAMRFFQDGLRNYPDSIPYIFNIGLIHFVKKNYKKAEQIYEDIFNKEPQSVSIFYNLLLSLLYQENYSAITRYRDINSFTRPRVLMSQEQMNINKIMVYSANKFHQGDLKPQSNDVQRDFLENLSQGHNHDTYQNGNLVPQKLEKNNGEAIIDSSKFNQHTHQSKVHYNDKYFRKNDITDNPKQNLEKLEKQLREKKLSPEKFKSESKLQSQIVPKKSMVQVFKQQFLKKREKFDQILEAKREVMKEKDNLYSNIETNIIKQGDLRSRTPENSNRKSQMLFTIATQKVRSNSLDKIYKDLSELTRIYTKGYKDPIEEKYKELIEDLRLFKSRMNIRKFVKEEQDREEEKQEQDKREIRPWMTTSSEKLVQDNPMMRSKQMDRARSFIKSSIGAKTKKEGLQIARNIENLVDNHIKKIQENLKGDQQRRYEAQISQLQEDLQINESFLNPLKEDFGAEQLQEIDKSFVERLEKMKDLNQLTEDQRMMQILGITGQDLEKRKEMQQDKLLQVLCPDGVTSEDRESFDKDTDEFLSYLQNNYLIKSAIVPGTEIPHLFRDSQYYEQIKKYIDKLSQTITSRLGIFNEDLNISHDEQDVEVKWESPLKTPHHKQNSLYSQIIKKSQELDGESTAKSTLAYIFLQKINTMGFLNKIVKDNISKIKSKRKKTYSTNASNLNLQELKYVEQQLVKQKGRLLRLIDYQLIDNVLQDLKFFSIFEKEVRVKIYKLGSYLKIQQEQDQIVDHDIEITENMYIVLCGSVTLMKRDKDLGIDIPLTTFKAGDCFGDLSIQSLTVNPFDLLSKNKVFAKADHGDPCHLFVFKREEFIAAIFKEMKEALYKKIMMLKQADFFSDLSPYALVILASNVQIREYKLGDILCQQGTEPQECFIILEGECRSVYMHDFTKSTKVSKYAKKCLQTTLPRPLHFNGVDYKQLAHGDQQTGKKDMPLNEDQEEKIRKAVQELNQNKYSFQNEIVDQDKLTEKIKYRHHIVFDELKPGNCVGYRTLLDKQIVRRHVIDEAEAYSDQLKIYPATIQAEMKHNLKSQMTQQVKPKTNSPLKRKQSISKLRRNKTIQIEKQDEEEEQLSINLKLINQIDEATAQVRDLLIEDEMKANNSGSENVLSTSQSRLIRSDSMIDNKVPLHLAEEITPRRPEEELLTRNQLIVKSRLYDRLMSELLKSQLTIVAHTSFVKVMVIKKEDKNFLNETLKTIIDRKLIEKRFKDIDRPKDNIAQILDVIGQEKSWKTYKAKLEMEMLREVAMNKKLNKLLD